MKFIALFKNRFVVLGISLVMLAVAFFLDNSKERHDSNYEALTRSLQAHLNKKERLMQKVLDNDSLLKSFLQNGFNLENKEELTRKDFILLIYKDTTLRFWSENRVDARNVLKKADEIDVLETSNGWYLYNKKTLGTTTYVVLYPFYTEYQYSNDYLQSHFGRRLDVENKASFSSEAVQGYQPLKSIYGKKLVYVFLQPHHQNHLTVPVIILFLVGLWLFFIFLSAQYEWFLVTGKPVWGTIFFGLVLLALRFLVLDLRFPSFLHQSTLFDPGLYASSLFSSLGALVVNVVLLFIFVFTFSRQTDNFLISVKKATTKPLYSAWVFIPSFFVLIVFTAFIINVIRSLILDSNIPFDVSNIFVFTRFSLVGLLVTALLVSIHFFSSNIVFLLTEKMRLDNKKFVLYAILATVLYGLYEEALGVFKLSMVVQASAYVFSLLLVLQMSKNQKMLQKTVAYVLVVSVFVGLLFYRFNIDREHEIRSLYAIKFSDAKDIEAESLFADIESQIASDPRVVNYFTNAIYNKRDLEKHIKQLYFSGYLSKYDVQIYDYDTLGNHFRENNYYTYEFVNNLYNNFARSTLSNYFYYIVYPSVQYQYIARYDYCTGKRTLGSLFILLKRKLIQDQSLFTELLSESSGTTDQPPYNYSYALYQNNKLVNKGGKYSYTLNFSFDTTENDEFIVASDYSHLIKHEPNNTIIVVSKKVDSVLQPLSIFSFLFLMLLLFIALLYVYNGLVMLIRAGLAYYTGKWKPLLRVYRFTRWMVPVKRMRGLLFSTRIQFTMFTLVSVILLLSGYIFLQYIDFKYTERQRDKMMRKIQAVVTAFENEAQFEMKLMLPAELTAYLNQIGDFYGTDINFYNVDGQLIASTKSKIFTAGLQAGTINPEAYEKMRVENQSFFIHDEEIGHLKYISAYVPVMDTKHSVMAYINLPFFTNEAELNEEISTFFVNFVNLYILFFLVAAVVAYIITQRITAPLTLIQNKLSHINLGGSNEIIDWDSDDEIGELVAQYNKMIMALEESISRLAESERQGAWKEMAKQIAHEIKNPLTPMKLSVQHLQRAWANKGENLDETFRKVTNVIIEQIDSLSNLASEFSSFAKMPAPVAERLELNALVQSVVQLYAGSPDASISFTPGSDEAVVMADKDQVSRVFKNIITNAIQAIPEGQEGAIDINLVRKGSCWQTSIADNGKGIGPEEAAKVFIPSFSTKTSGMGLGLAISKKIIENSGGKIYFESVVGSGTTFYIELPSIEETDADTNQ